VSCLMGRCELEAGPSGPPYFRSSVRSISTTRFDPVQKLAKRGFGRPFIFGQCFCPSVDGPLRSPEISAVTRRQMVIAHEPDAIEVLVSDQPAVA